MGRKHKVFIIFCEIYFGITSFSFPLFEIFSHALLTQNIRNEMRATVIVCTQSKSVLCAPRAIKKFLPQINASGDRKFCNKTLFLGAKSILFPLTLRFGIIDSAAKNHSLQLKFNCSQREISFGMMHNNKAIQRS